MSSLRDHNTYMRTHIHTYTYTYTHTYTHTEIQSGTYTHTNTYIHTGTHSGKISWRWDCVQNLWEMHVRNVKITQRSIYAHSDAIKTTTNFLASGLYVCMYVCMYVQWKLICLFGCYVTTNGLASAICQCCVPECMCAFGALIHVNLCMWF